MKKRTSFPKSFRLTGIALRNLERLQRDTGLSQTAVVEMALALAGWQYCTTHGRMDGNRAWGCPECVRELREKVKLLEDAADPAAAALIHVPDDDAEGE
jgi:hypothetical protein